MSKVMTDPLANVRERLDRAEEVEASGVEVSNGTRQYTADVRLVLADVDALLAVVRAAEEYIRLQRQSMGMPMPNKYRIAYEEALADLPKHLK